MITFTRHLNKTYGKSIRCTDFTSIHRLSSHEFNFNLVPVSYRSNTQVNCFYDDLLWHCSPSLFSSDASQRCCHRANTEHEESQRSSAGESRRTRLPNEPPPFWIQPPVNFHPAVETTPTSKPNAIARAGTGCSAMTVRGFRERRVRETRRVVNSELRMRMSEHAGAVVGEFDMDWEVWNYNEASGFFSFSSSILHRSTGPDTHQHSANYFPL